MFPNEGYIRKNCQICVLKYESKTNPLTEITAKCLDLWCTTCVRRALGMVYVCFGPGIIDKFVMIRPLTLMIFVRAGKSLFNDWSIEVANMQPIRLVGFQPLLPMASGRISAKATSSLEEASQEVATLKAWLELFTFQQLGALDLCRWVQVPSNKKKCSVKM